MVPAHREHCAVNRLCPVDSTIREEWQEKGWALVPGLIGDDELDALRGEAKRLWADKSQFVVRGTVPNSPARNDRLDPFIDLSPAFAKLARDARLLAVVGDVLDGAPQLMKDKLIFKPGGAGGYAAHQDGAYWQGMGFDLGRFLTAFLFLDDATADNGAVECTSGQHRGLLTPRGIVADPAEDQLDAFSLVDAAAGDLLLVHALTPHRSGSNRTPAMRRALAFTYGVDARPDIYSLYQQFQQDARS